MRVLVREGVPTGSSEPTPPRSREPEPERARERSNSGYFALACLRGEWPPFSLRRSASPKIETVRVRVLVREGVPTGNSEPTPPRSREPEPERDRARSDSFLPPRLRQGRLAALPASEECQSQDRDRSRARSRARRRGNRQQRTDPSTITRTRTRTSSRTVRFVHSPSLASGANGRPSHFGGEPPPKSRPFATAFSCAKACQRAAANRPLHDHAHPNPNEIENDATCSATSIRG